MKTIMKSKKSAIVMAILTVLFLGIGVASGFHLAKYSEPLFLQKMGGKTNNFWIESVLFIIFACFFLVALFEAGTVLSIDRVGISLSFLFFFEYAHMTWENVEEICVIYDDDSEKNQNYIYFSNDILSTLERFKIVYPYINSIIKRQFLGIFMKEEEIKLISEVCGRNILYYTKDDLYGAAELLLMDESEKKYYIGVLEKENWNLKAEIKNLNDET